MTAEFIILTLTDPTDLDLQIEAKLMEQAKLRDTETFIVENVSVLSHVSYEDTPKSYLILTLKVVFLKDT